MPALTPVLYSNRVGKGKVIFLASLDSPGKQGVRKLYSFLLAKAMEAEGQNIWPKVECTDSVRWSTYADGTVYLLNTEDHLPQEAIVTLGEGRTPQTVRLAPGELKEIR